jgi:hypothetical protein
VQHRHQVLAVRRIFCTFAKGLSDRFKETSFTRFVHTFDANDLLFLLTWDRREGNRSLLPGSARGEEVSTSGMRIVGGTGLLISLSSHPWFALWRHDFLV